MAHKVAVSLRRFNTEHRFLQERKVKMLSLWTKLTMWVKEEKGASMVEYALLVVLIAIIAIVAVSIAGQQVSTAFSTIANTLSN
jgi:pilus assembly protein Flp/PilA